MANNMSMFKNNPYNPGSQILYDPVYKKPLKEVLIDIKGGKDSTALVREVIELCLAIDQHGQANDVQPHRKFITFGGLFDVYNYLSSKFLSILVKARKHGLVYFEGEMLYQGRDDDVPIFLVRNAEEIKREQKALEDQVAKDLSEKSKLPLSTTMLLAKGKQMK
ncbi:actin-binding Rho-activating protein-like [Condylostylus longicornis]|uniref:actin-binding Rho-activating protein-like n=1 Tax=Condylostylus longicornis TaxID=2530218 RepID=UPI00244E244A|nr:actin-binding Rho-activating protein-like [Condylostylus longicornis]